MKIKKEILDIAKKLKVKNSKLTSKERETLCDLYQKECWSGIRNCGMYRFTIAKGYEETFYLINHGEPITQLVKKDIFNFIKDIKKLPND